MIYKDLHEIVTPLSNTPAGRRFFGGFLTGGSSVGRILKFLGGVQQNWAGQCEIVGGVGLSRRRHDMQLATVIANSGWGRCEPPSGSRGAKHLEAPGISHFLVAENGLKYQKILQFTVLQKRPKLHFQCNVSFLSIL